MNMSLFECSGGTYSVASGYRIPNLTLPDEPEHSIGLWGRQRLDYLKQHRRVLYVNLLTSGKLADICVRLMKHPLSGENGLLNR